MNLEVSLLYSVHWGGSTFVKTSGIIFMWCFAGWGNIFCTHPYQPCGPHSPLYIGYWDSFPLVNWWGHDIDHSPQLAPKLKKE